MGNPLYLETGLVSVGVTTVPVWIHSDGRRLQSRNQNKHKLSLVTKIEISLEHLRLKYRYLEVELHLKFRAAVRSTPTPVESKAADSCSRVDDAATTSRWKCLEEFQRHVIQKMIPVQLFDELPPNYSTISAVFHLETCSEQA